MHTHVVRGQAQHGELGYGPKGKKSSANPEKCQALEGVTTHQVSPSLAALLLAPLKAVAVQPRLPCVWPPPLRPLCRSCHRALQGCSAC